MRKKLKIALMIAFIVLSVISVKSKLQIPNQPSPGFVNEWIANSDLKN